MTTEQQRKYAAVEIVGWKLGTTITVGREQSAYDKFVPEKNDLGAWTSIECGAANRWTCFGSTVMDYGSWRPDQDRDQLWLVLEKCEGEWFDALDRRGIDVNVDDRTVEHYCFWPMCMLDPAKALEAVVEAHQKRNGRRG